MIHHVLKAGNKDTEIKSKIINYNSELTNQKMIYKIDIKKYFCK